MADTPVSPTNVSALPTAPNRNTQTDPLTYSQTADAWAGALPTWTTQVNNIAANVNFNADSAFDSSAEAFVAKNAAEAAETAAEAAQAAAESASNATQWVSGQAYVAGDVVWSPSSYLSYRAVGATSGTVDPSQSASWVLLAANVPRFTNPLAQAVRVAMTAAASGSTGIQVPDDPDIDIGTNNFTVHWEGSLPDWTPSALVRVLYKFQNSSNRYTFQVNTNGTLLVFVASGGVTLINASSTVATGLTDGSYAKITASVIRETASAAGSVTFYVNGVQLGTAVSITAAAAVNADNSGLLYISGDNTLRYASDNLNSILYNRALSAAEVLSLAINGPALADLGASQTPVYTSDFSAGVDGWVAGSSSTVTGNTDAINGQDDWLAVERISSTGALTASRPITSTCLRRNNLMRLFNPAGSGYSFVRITATGAIATQTDAVVAIAENSQVDVDLNLLFINRDAAIVLLACNSAGNSVSVAPGSKMYAKNFVLKSIGITGQWNAQDAQSNTGQIFDSSGNKNHAKLPVDGATIIGKESAQLRQVRWTNTWDGTNELQYIGGVNQAILPANAYIESIVGTVTGATPHDIIIGNGSDTDRYVTITTDLAAGTTSFTLANRTTNGTNLKLTVDPDTDATMSIAWVISYTTLE